MSRYHIVLWIDGERSELHTFDLPYGAKGWYRMITSLNAFKTSENKRLNAIWGKEPISSLHKRAAVDYDYELFRSIPEIGELMHNELTHYHHNDLWDLYEAIGYDRKTKKYVK